MDADPLMDTETPKRGQTSSPERPLPKRHSPEQQQHYQQQLPIESSVGPSSQQPATPDEDVGVLCNGGCGALSSSFQSSYHFRTHQTSCKRGQASKDDWIRCACSKTFDPSSDINILRAHRLVCSQYRARQKLQPNKITNYFQAPAANAAAAAPSEPSMLPPELPEPSVQPEQPEPSVLPEPESPAASPLLSTPPAGSDSRYMFPNMQCMGFELQQWPQPSPQPQEHFGYHYPFQLHGEMHGGTPTLQFAASTDGFLRSFSCRGWCLVSFLCCPACAQLGHLTVVKQIKERASKPADEGLNFRFRTHQQMVDNANSRALQHKQASRNAYNAQRKLAGLVTGLSLHKQLVMYLGANRVPRLHQLLSAGLRAGRGISGLMEKAAAAVAGVYKPKGFDQEDMDAALMAWRLGGKRCIAALGAREGYASITTIARACSDVGFRLSSKGFSSADVDANIQSMLLHGDRMPKVMMVDEVAGEEAPRFDSRYMGVLRRVCDLHIFIAKNCMM